MSAGDTVHLTPGQIPEDYHCRCDYCTQAIGELIRPDGTYYSRHERRGYYDKRELGADGHIAKTPLHIARWAVQRYTDAGQWVLDPTVGSGTTIVEAITQGRNGAGVELQFVEVLEANVLKNKERGTHVIIGVGDARQQVPRVLEQVREPVHLVVNNPPYSGDETYDPKAKRDYAYQDGLPNLAFLRENEAYWGAMHQVYRACVDGLAPGGRVVIGVKDMMRHKKPFLLHKGFCDLLAGFPDLEFEGTAFLRHHPGTLHLNTYEKRYGVKPPLYQTINVFRKN